MTFETKQDVLDWYERQPRSVTPEFLASIDWSEVKRHPFDTARFIPVLLYMRDVESLTEMYHRELMRTPTGRDPHIRKFMDRWGVEELAHGELLNRFLGELGYASDEGWRAQVHGAVSTAYRANAFLITTLTKMIGRRFTATHMTFGAIHEMSTTQGYRRLKAMADHPVLTQILEAIIREESAHTNFYASVARLELKNSKLAQRMARFVIEHFWAPVGQGSLPKRKTEYVIATLFGSNEGLEALDKTVTQRVRRFPGFADLTKINETMRAMAKTLDPAHLL